MKISLSRIRDSVENRLSRILDESKSFRVASREDGESFSDLLDGTPALIYNSIEDIPSLALNYEICLTEDRIEVYLGDDFRAYCKEGYTEVDSLKKDGSDVLSYLQSIQSEDNTKMNKRIIVSFLKNNGFRRS